MSQAAIPQQHGDARLKCGQCRWFVQQVGGKTCQQTRAVMVDTRACIEFQQFKNSPFAAIQADKYIYEVRSTLKVWTEETIKKFDKEIKTYRAVKLEGLKDPMAYLDESNLAELGHRLEVVQAYSERLLDIRFELMDKKSELNSLAKDVQSYLMAEYRDYIQSCKNDGERGALFRTVAPEVFKALDKMDNLYDKAELAYQILKDAHFALSKKIEAVLELYKARVMSIKVSSGSGGSYHG